MTDDRYRELFEAVGDAIVVVDRYHTITMVNGQAELVFGHASEEMIGRQLDVLLPARYRGSHGREMEGFASGIERRRPMSKRETLWGLRRDGEEFPVEVTISRLGDGDGCDLMAVVRDVSEREDAREVVSRLEGELEEADRWRHSAFERSPVAKIEWDAELGIIGWNQAAERLFGFCTAEASTEAARLAEALAAGDGDSGWNRALRGEFGPGQTVEHVTKSGRVVVCDWYHIPRIAGDGSVVGVSSEVFDVTERIRLEEAMHQAQALARVGSWELDLVQGELWWSPELYRIFEIDREEFGASYEAFLNAIHPDDRVAVDEAYNRSVENGKPYQIVHRLLMSDGRIKWIEERGETDYDTDRGTPLRSRGTAQEVTEREQGRQRLEESLRSRTELIASVSHELRTPLTAVTGFAQLLHDQGTSISPDERDEMVRTIVDESTDLTNLVEDLLTAAKSEANTLTTMRVPVDLRTQAERTLRSWSRRDVVTVEIRGDGWAVGDHARIRQILRNLLDNAARYGGQDVRIAIEREESTVSLRVMDDGPGVPHGDWESIFEPYRRAHATPGRTMSMGLGLAICRQLAHLMGGDLTYRYQDGTSIFELTLAAAERESRS